MAPIEPTQPATALNPEAGDHLVTADPVLMRACAAAVDRTYQRYPYYRLRYGDRGRAFSASDSGWLVTVAALDQESAVREVMWLGRVLAARGMPRLLLEDHLGHLSVELDAVAGQRSDAADTSDGFAGRDLVGTLRACAGALRARREDAIRPPDAVPLLAAFESSAPAAERDRLPRTGQMLVAAVADERDGIANAVGSLLSWIADPARFPAAWVRAATDVVEGARALPSTG